MLAANMHVLKAGLVDLDFSSVFMLGLFLVLFHLLNKTLFQPMLDMFDKRHALTDGARDAANSAVAAAESRITEYEERVAGARREAIAETKRLRSEGLAAEREMLQGVRQEANEQVDKGITELNAAVVTAQTELDQNAQELGKQIAAQVLGGAA